MEKSEKECRIVKVVENVKEEKSESIGLRCVLFFEKEANYVVRVKEERKRARKLEQI